MCVFGVCIPESEDEEHQQHAEGGHVVHGLHQHHQLSPQGGQEADQLQNPQQTKCPQDGQPPVCLTDYLPHTEEHIPNVRYNTLGVL